MTIESLRADHVGWHGYPRATTPNLDRLAAGSLDFRNAYSVTSWTLTSHASLFTGLYPGAHRVVEPRDRLADGATTVAGLFRKAGWQTCALVSGPYLRRPYGLDQGFESYDDSIAAPADRIDDELTNPKMEKGVEEFLDHGRDPARPFFLFLYFWDPHYAYLPPPPYDTMFVPPGAEKVGLRDYDRNTAINAAMPKSQLDYVVSQYDGEIRATDETLGRILSQLRAHGLEETTALVITADHGEEFFDHGQKGHKNNLYAESLHVPLLVRPAGGCTPGRDERVASGVDLFPTLLDLCGLTYDGPLHGRSLLEPDDPDRPTFHELVTTWYFNVSGASKAERRSDRWEAVRLGDRLLMSIEFHDGPHETRLFDPVADPREQTKLDEPATTARLAERLATYRRDVGRLADALHASAPAHLTPEEEQRLRAMGYIKDK